MQLSISCARAILARANDDDVDSMNASERAGNTAINFDNGAHTNYCKINDVDRKKIN